MTRKDILKKYGYCWMSNVDLRKETIIWTSQRKEIGNILGMLHERTSINKTTKELRND